VKKEENLDDAMEEYDSEEEEESVEEVKVEPKVKTYTLT